MIPLPRVDVSLRRPRKLRYYLRIPLLIHQYVLRSYIAYYTIDPLQQGLYFDEIIEQIQ